MNSIGTRVLYPDRNMFDYLSSIATNMDLNMVLDIFFAITTLGMFQALRHIRPIDIESKLDIKRHAHPLLPLMLKNKVITFWTLVVPVVLILVLESLYPQTRGLSHATNFIWRFCLTGVLCQIIKLVVSSPRPNAIHLEDEKVNIYCDNSNFESRQSFFSGHAAAGICSALFFKSYLEFKFPQLISHPLFNLILTLLPVVGLYPGYTQWKQNWHHLHDVLFGYFYGYFSYEILFIWTYNWQI